MLVHHPIVPKLFSVSAFKARSLRQRTIYIADACSLLNDLLLDTAQHLHNRTFQIEGEGSMQGTRSYGSHIVGQFRAEAGR
jgi:hypothetical protein